MAATVVDGSVTSSNWQKHKPEDYQGGKDLESALKDFDALNKKDVTFDALPTLPKTTSIKEYTQCSKDLKSSSDELTKVVAHFTSLKSALGKVASAADKNSGELRKLAKDKKDDDKKKYMDAAGVASAISAQAASAAKKLE